ncbi:hypothetical protein DM860_002531 [Cuscuta australis]|uniref:Fungal lipase-like domain-containing protein n=1 Tax=Cuscuta australis TaxID=267555 RepID=A0A328D3S8_9ASTE|nr:hypothetical protein DM860_002531 [Cuscuta australis]
MAATTMATVAGAVILMYYVLSRRLSGKEEDEAGGEYSKSVGCRSVERRLSRRHAQAPATWRETISTLAETLRFTYSETLGKWPIADLAFGINYLIRKQGNLKVASVYAGDNCLQLKGADIIAQLYDYLRLLTLCYLFSKKPFSIFLETAGYSPEDVLLQKPKAGLLKPAFTILRDKNLKCFLLLIRGTHSIKDTLTAATGDVVPFHHSVLNDGGIGNLVLGYAHCGMVAAARWIAKLSIPSLLKALEEYPEYEVKVVGHSLGGGTAALLTYILREREDLSSITCVTFAPAACMTWELAESGKHFITTIINGADLVPTFSTSSIDVLRTEVTSSSWLNDLRDQVERNRVLKVIYRSATALGPSIAVAKARVAGAGALLRPVSSSTQVVMRRAQDVAQAVVKTTRPSLSAWSCIGPRRRVVSQPPISKTEDLPPESPLLTQATPHKEETDDEGGDDTPRKEVKKCVDSTEGKLWYELEKQLEKQDNDTIHEQEEEEAATVAAAAAIEITLEEEKVALLDAVGSQTQVPPFPDNLQFYPPGRIMHIVAVDTGGNSDGLSEEERVGIYETPRDLYSKLRLSKTMINDHYMPMYKKMMELLIRELENELL